MKRHELEHVIRAATAVANVREIVIVGSQAILGALPDAPEEVLRSQEADCFPLSDPAKADLIDGAIGELSPFHLQFGYYAHGVAPGTAILPDGWRERLVPIRNENTAGGTGWCLSIGDLVASKLAAGREKDIEFVSALLGHKAVSADELTGCVERLPREYRDVSLARLDRLKDQRDR
ncbi:MAG TPA: hypothetical protein PKE12_04065 [Kiritimatiellia bacterium]|nr:hypothetical protein [Kiritimatiellia bacterium]